MALASTATPCGTNESNCWTCGADCVARLDSAGKMTISGSGNMKNYNLNIYAENQGYGGLPAPWDEHMNDIKSVSIDYGITSIGTGAFFKARQLSDVSIPDSVIKIGASAFNSATSLTSLNIPDSVTSIQSSAFASTAITDITLPKSLETIGDSVFNWLHGLQSIVLPESLKTMSNDVFANSGITTVYCTGEQMKDGGICSEISNWRGYNVSTNTYFTWEGNIVHYEQEGNHFNIYDSNGNIVAQYKNAGDFGTTRTYQRRTSYTPAEAAQHVNHTNNNKVIFTFK